MVFRVIRVLARLFDYLKRKFRSFTSAKTPGMQGQDSEANADQTSEAPLPGTEHEPSQGSLPCEANPILTVKHPDSSKELVHPSSPIAGSSSRLHPPSTGSDQPVAGMRSSSNASEPSNTSSHSELTKSFRMIIHLPNERIGQRLACLDTCSEVDLVSHQVVDSLHLETEKYTGVAIKPLGPATNIYKPERKAKIEWHVAKFHKTYTTVFAVLDTAHSEEFDILLGLETINKIGFIKKNRDIWWNSAGRQVCLSDDTDQ
ncbi:MAG: hypothetical protein Q9176_003870 [Flavoplaca citrina]